MNTEKLMPIVPGCRALIVAGEGMGETCRVDSWLGDGAAFGGFVNGTGKDGWFVSFDDGDVGVYLPSALMRIDGGDFADEFMRESTSDVEEIKRRIERC